VVNAGWARRNLGIDYTAAERPVAAELAAVGRRRARPDASGPTAAEGRALRRELIEFDSEAPEGAAFRALASAAPGGLAQFVEIAWPHGLVPKPGKRPHGTSLPKADVLIVTWTVDEGHSLSRVLTPGIDSHDDWKPYRKNYTAISSRMRNGCPARQYGRLGTYWTTEIGSQRVTLFKSDSHMSQDGPKLPNAAVWQQIIEDCRPQLVITTGTGGGIGPQFEVGDVIVSRFTSFDCQREFKKLDRQSFSSPTDPPRGRFTTARSLFSANAGFLPPDNTRKPRIFRAPTPDAGILTTDFFGFDNTTNTYGLQGKGNLSEMGDAVLGMVCNKLKDKAPTYTIVRNVSDPQIDSTNLTLAQQTAMAADIYKAYGRWSSVCSAIVCWAIIAAL
jgi:Phosphorylase superfamily